MSLVMEDDGKFSAIGFDLRGLGVICYYVEVRVGAVRTLGQFLLLMV